MLSWRPNEVCWFGIPWITAWYVRLLHAWLDESAGHRRLIIDAGRS